MEHTDPRLIQTALDVVAIDQQAEAIALQIYCETSVKKIETNKDTPDAIGVIAYIKQRELLK